MANVLPEVRPAVESMPHEGFVMQTGGSARRSVIKNDGKNTYHVHGVPGHTHNASAMISVTADYARTRTVATAIPEAWAEEKVDIGVGTYVDSVEPDDAAELYDRAIERGIGKITLVPENCQHNITEPVRSISEIRTIVSGKDRRDTMTYVENEYGWVDPVTGLLATDFNRAEPVQVNFYGYPAPLGDTVTRAIPHVQVPNSPTLRQPIYIGSRTNLNYRYAILSPGSDTGAGPADWDGNVPFTWDEASRTYKSKAFTKYFQAARIQTRQTPQTEQAQIGTGPHINRTLPVVSTVILGAVQVGSHVGDVTIPQGNIHVTGDSVTMKDALSITPLHPALVVIPQLNFKVRFPAYSTQPAKDGFCVISRVHSDIMFSQTIKYDQGGVGDGVGFNIVPDLPVDLEYPNNIIAEQPYWFGPPAYRIPVGGRFALPGPIRDKRIDESGEGFPGQYNDHQADFFGHVSNHNGSNLVLRSFAYNTQFISLLDPGTMDNPANPGNLISRTLEQVPRSIDMSAGNNNPENFTRQDLFSICASAAPGNNFQLPVNHAGIRALYWDIAVSNFFSAPYFFLQYNQNRLRHANEPDQVPAPDTHTYFRRALMDEKRIGVSGMDEQFKFEESPYLKGTGSMYYPTKQPAGYLPRYTCDGRVNRPFLRIQSSNVVGVETRLSPTTSV